MQTAAGETGGASAQLPIVGHFGPQEKLHAMEGLSFGLATSPSNASTEELNAMEKLNFGFANSPSTAFAEEAEKLGYDLDISPLNLSTKELRHMMGKFGVDPVMSPSTVATEDPAKWQAWTSNSATSSEEKTPRGHTVEKGCSEKGLEEEEAQPPAWARMRTPSPEARYMALPLFSNGTAQLQPMVMPSFYQPWQEALPRFRQQEGRPLLATPGTSQAVPPPPPPPPQPLSLEEALKADPSGRGGRRASRRPSQAQQQQPQQQQQQQQQQRRTGADRRQRGATSPTGSPPIPSETAWSSKLVLSVGSVGHPYTCAQACKYSRGSRVCKDGANCDHCHVCVWKRSEERARATRK